jgi:hypothetical protein
VGQDEELNITPIMNLVVVLIPLLLATAEFVKLGLLETRLPPAAAGGGSGMSEEQDKPLSRLSLVVSVDEGGSAVSIMGATSQSAEPGRYRYLPRLSDGRLDLAGLGAELTRIRREIVVPSITGKVQEEDALGKPVFNADGSPRMVEAYGYDDAENVMISAPNDLQFQVLVSLLDACRSIKNPSTGEMEKLFPSPLMGKIQ